MSGASQSHELNKYGFAKNRSVFSNKNILNSSRTGKKSKQRRQESNTYYDDYARQAQIYQNSANQMYNTQGMMHDISQSFVNPDDSVEMTRQGYGSPFTDGFSADQPRGSAQIINY